MNESELITFFVAFMWAIVVSAFIKFVDFCTHRLIKKSQTLTNQQKLIKYVKRAQAFRLPQFNYEELMQSNGGSERYFAMCVSWLSLLEQHSTLFSKTWMGNSIAVLTKGDPVDDDFISPILYPWLKPYLESTSHREGLTDMHINPMDVAQIDGGGVFLSVFPATFSGYVHFRTHQTPPVINNHTDGSFKLFLAARSDAVETLSKLGRSICQNSNTSPHRSSSFIIRRRGVREIPTPELILEVISTTAPAPAEKGEGSKIDISINMKAVHTQVVNRLEEFLGEDWPLVFTVGHFFVAKTPKRKFTVRAFSKWSRNSHKLQQHWVSDTDPYLMTIQEMESVVDDMSTLKASL